MSEFKGTPGPWEVIVGKSNVAGVNSTFTIQSDERLSIASGQSQEHLGDDGIHEDEMLANARLIAAAPELLEALQDAVDQLKCNLTLLMCDDEFIDLMTANARHVIAKALGDDAP